MSKMLCPVGALVASLMPMLSHAAPVARPVYMTSQIQRLLNEKQEKISKLEECDGKRKGFMIAGISTIGLTAVGVGVNIAQASKSNKLSNQIADQNRELEKQQSKLSDINSQISDIQTDNARRECEAQTGKIYVNGQCLDKQQYEQSIAQNQNGNDNQNNNQNTQQNNTSGNTISPHDGVIGEACMDGAGKWDKYDSGEKKCLVSKDTTEIVKCGCKMNTSLNTIPVVGGANAIGGANGGEITSGQTPSNGDIVDTTPNKLPQRDGSANLIPQLQSKGPGLLPTEPIGSAIPDKLSQRDGSANLIPQLQPKGPGVLPTEPVASVKIPQLRPERITGYCRDEEGTGLTEEGDYCYCSAEWMNPSCSENELFADQVGVCVGDKASRNAACTRFCQGKVEQFGKRCSLDR